MGEYYWDDKIEYLMNTRNLYYNDDYLAFLVKSVWKMTTPVDLLDFGCGYGYLGLKLMPLLPEGSSYTGIDKGGRLLDQARRLFENLPYPAEFIQSDVDEAVLERTYDIALCHALLLHMPDPVRTLSRMADSVRDGGKIICFEPHWISNMSNFYLHGRDQSDIVQLGVLQRLFELDARNHGKDGNVGIKIPPYMSELGLRNIECRMSDKVVFLNPGMEEEKKASLYGSLSADGIGSDPGDREAFVGRLVDRGLSKEEAEKQYAAELELFERFSIESLYTGAAGMKITWGTKENGHSSDRI